MKAATVLLAGLEVFRDELGAGKSDVQVSDLMCFLTVSATDETPMADLEKTLGLSQAATSRNVTRLSRGRPNDPGLDLIEAHEDPYERRRKLLRVTPRGRELLKKIEAHCARYMRTANAKAA